jgi:hypothetical protein
VPKIQNQAIYNAAYRATRLLLLSKSGRHPTARFREYAAGQYLYRYASQSLSEFAGNYEGARKIWRGVESDTENRWTGFGGGGPGGQVGLYTTLEQIGSGSTIFGELFHYLANEANPKNDQTIEYSDFEGAIVRRGRVKPEPALISHKAERMHYMFAFTLEKSIRVMDLRAPITPGDTSSFVYHVYELCLQNNPALFSSLNCIYLYNHPTDASFCRGIGNSCLELLQNGNGILTTSARDARSLSVIIKEPAGTELKYLKFAGRSTFFVEPATGTANGCAETIEDQIYNDKVLFNVVLTPAEAARRYAKKYKVKSMLGKAFSVFK